MENKNERRCLIVERHAWEKAARVVHLEVPQRLARDFFPWPTEETREITVRVFQSLTSEKATAVERVTVSPGPVGSTRRIEGAPFLGSLPASFVFIEETGEPEVYDCWWQEKDMPAVFARYRALWLPDYKGHRGRARLGAIVAAPVPRPILPTGNGIEATPPPFLSRVRIKGYKSIGFCDVTLEPLAVLVGRNGTGKSNFLGALALLRDILAIGTGEAVKRHDGRRAILRRGTDDAAISIGVEANYRNPITNSLHTANYEFELSLSERDRPAITTERVRVKERPDATEVGFDRDGNDVTWVGFGDESPLRDWCPAHRLMLSESGDSPFFELSAGLQNLGIYTFIPKVIRKPGIPSSGGLLDGDGGNLAGVLETVHDVNPVAYERIVRYLAAIVPEIEEVKVHSVGEHLVIRFRVRSGRERQQQWFNASNMSDGTLRALAALTAVAQVHLLDIPGMAVGIEEPETSLHPAAVRALVDALDEATLKTQVLLTTHSAEFLDNPTIRPENVRVVQLVDGQTIIGPIDQAGVEIVNQELNTLGGLERENQLEPDLDDQDRQKQLAGNGRGSRP